MSFPPNPNLLPPPSVPWQQYLQAVVMVVVYMLVLYRKDPYA